MAAQTASRLAGDSRALLDGMSTGAADQVGETCSVETSCVVDAPVRNAVTLPVVGQIDLEQLGLPPVHRDCRPARWVQSVCHVGAVVHPVAARGDTQSRDDARRGWHLRIRERSHHFAFMAAWLNVFLLVGWTREIQIGLGVFALIAGALNTKDYLALGHGPSLSIPAQVKPSIYRRVNRVVHAERL